MVRRPSVNHHFQRSSKKSLGLSKPNFIWSLSGMGEQKFVCGGLGYMTKMAATPIYGKNPSKIFFPRTKGPMALWLGMYIGNLGPSLFGQMVTLTYLTARSNLVPYAFIWGKTVSSLMEETYSKWPEWQKVYVKIKILTPGGCLPLPRGYIHV